MSDWKVQQARLDRINPQGNSSTFKNVSRDKKANWANRFVRDHNDLIYDADPHSISNKLKQNAKPLPQSTRKEEDSQLVKKYQYSPIKHRQQMKSSQSQRNLKKGLKVDNYLSSVQQMEKMKRCAQTAATTRKTGFIDEEPEVRPFNAQEKDDKKKQESRRRNSIDQNIQELNEFQLKTTYKHANLLGLSQFEFSSTIEGRLTKTNHHLDFDRNKTTKLDNLNRVWYDKAKDIEKPEESLLKQKASSMQRIHSFKSYQPHRLFHKTKRMLQDNGSGNGGMLDQFYQIGSPQKYEVTHKRTVNNNVNYRSMSARPDLCKKLGTNLEYKISQVQTLGIGNSKRPIMHMSNSVRKLTFTRQVISPSRGCFR